MFDWFSENLSKTNADKCDLIASSKVPVDIPVSDIKVTSKSSKRSSFDYHFSQLCKKASKKLKASVRIFE